LIHTDRNLPLAVQLLRRYISSSSTVEQGPIFKAHYLLGTALQKQGDKQSAEREYRSALALARSFSPAQQALQRVNQ
jgi:Flp pilus assembly protein TadD